MNVKRIVLAALTLPVFLVGCGGTSADGDVPTQPAPVEEFYEYGDYQTVKVVKIDGVKCFLYHGYESGGIWCLEGTPLTENEEEEPNDF